MRILLFVCVIFSLSATEYLPIGYLDQDFAGRICSRVVEELFEEAECQNDERTNRSTCEYGYSFFKLAQGDRSYELPPQFLQELGKRVCEELGRPSQNFTNFIISFYETGFHLEPHVDINSDHPHAGGFYFSEDVYGVILEADAEGCLYFICHEGEGLPSLDEKPIYTLDEKPGMVFCLTGELRRMPYYHAVSRVANRRVSITFRNVHFTDEIQE